MRRDAETARPPRHRASASPRPPSSLISLDRPPLTSSANEVEHRDALLYEYYWEWSFPQTPTTFAIRGERYKLIHYQGIWDTDELYDLVEDPQETRNLIGEARYDERVSRMQTRLYERLKRSGDWRSRSAFSGVPGPTSAVRTARSDRRFRRP